MRAAGRPSWEIRIDQPRVLAIALYVRDVAGIPPTARSADLPEVAPPVARAGTAPPGPAASAEWNAWWSRALAIGSRALADLRPPAFDAFAGAPALQLLLAEHVDAAVRWAESRAREHADRMMSSRLPFWELVADVERAIGRTAEPFSLRIDEVPVAGSIWRPVSESHVLASPALLDDRAALFAAVRRVIERLA